MPDLRRQRRVVYHTNIRLRSPGGEDSVVARVQNLSKSGAFVTAPELPSAGTEVVCRLAVAGERCTLKGRIAWTRPSTPDEISGGMPPSGAGISFVGVTEKDEELLGRLVEPPPSDRQPVDVWFEGMSKPIRSHASIGADGLGLSTRLPFLRLRSPVRVSFVRNGVEEVRSGVLDAVTLEPSGADGIPQLQLTVSTPLSDAATGLMQTPEPAPGTPPEGVLLGEPRFSAESADDADDPEPAQVVVEPEPPPISAPHVSDGRTQPYHRPLDPLTPPPAAPSLLNAPPVAPKRSNRTALVLFAILLLAGAAGVGYRLSGGASAIMTARAVEPTPPPPPAPAPTPPPPPVVAAAAPAPAEPAEAAPAEDDSKDTAKDSPASKDEDDGKDVEGFVVTGDRDDASLVVALAGTAKGMRQFRLMDPPGLLLRFPKARLKAAPGVHAPGGPFKRVVVGHKGPSGHVRIYLTPEQTADLAAPGDANSVKVSIHTKRKR